MESSLGKRIAEQRKRKNLTQDQLAEAFGVTPQAVSKWENDLSCPDILMLPQIADFFGVSADELLRGRPVADEARMVPRAERKNLDDMLLKIVVDSEEGDRVRVNLPVPLVKLGLEIGMQFPQVSDHDLMKKIDFEHIFQLVEQGVIGRLVEVDASDGSHVEVVVE